MPRNNGGDDGAGDDGPAQQLGPRATSNAVVGMPVNNIPAIESSYALIGS